MSVIEGESTVAPSNSVSTGDSAVPSEFSRQPSHDDDDELIPAGFFDLPPSKSHAKIASHPSNDDDDVLIPAGFFDQPVDEVTGKVTI